jgi:hypothetical protein
MNGIAVDINGRFEIRTHTQFLWQYFCSVHGKRNVVAVAAAISVSTRQGVHKKNGVFWDVTPCGSCKNRRFGGTYRLYH